MSDANTTWSTAFRGLIADRAPSAEKPVRTNPRPPGVVRRGSTTHLLWDHLSECPGRLFTAGELQAILGAPRGAISFSASYLVGLGLLEVVEDPRNSRYQRYRLKNGSRATISDRRVDETAQTGGDSDRPAVAALHPMPERDGSTTHPKALAWAQRREGSLHAEKLRMDGACSPATSSDVLSPGAPAGRVRDDGRRGSEASKHAGYLGSAEPPQARLQPGTAAAQEAVSVVPLDHLGGRDPADTGVGPTSWDPTECSVESHSPGDAPGTSDDVGPDASAQSEVGQGFIPLEVGP